MGNRQQVVEADGSSIHWGYDDAYRLTSEVRLGSRNSTPTPTVTIPPTFQPPTNPPSGTPVPPAPGTVSWQAAYSYDPTENRVSQTING